MILKQVTKQIKQIYPLYDDTFSVSNKITDYSYLDGMLKFTTQFSHGLEVGDFVVIAGIKAVFPTTFDFYDSITGILRVNLDPNHQIFASDKTVEVLGFNLPEFNGTFPLISITDDVKLDIQLPKNLTIDAMDIKPKQILKNLDKYVNGYHKVINIEEEISFNVTMTLIVNSPLNLDFAVIKTSRVTGTADFEWTLEKKKETVKVNEPKRPWLYVTLERTDIDKVTTFNKSYVNTNIIDMIAVYAVYPVRDENLAVDAVDLLRNNVYKAICRCILYTWFPTIDVWEDGYLKPGTNNPLTIGTIQKYKFDSANLIYRFTFLFASQMTLEDGYTLEEERRFREIDIDINDYWKSKQKL